MSEMSFREYVKELRRLGFKRKRIYKYYLEKERLFRITRQQAIKIINAS